MDAPSLFPKYVRNITYVVGLVIVSILPWSVNHATFLFNSTVTFLNLPPTMGPKYPNDESTTCNHNDGSLCRRRELMRTVTRRNDIATVSYKKVVVVNKNVLVRQHKA